MNWPRSTAGDERADRPWSPSLPAVALLALLGLLVACQPAPAMPTLAATEVVQRPLLSPTVTNDPKRAADVAPSTADASAQPTAVLQLVTTEAGATAILPAAAPGIRPAEAQLQRPLEALPELGPAGDG
ncbi:MAG: hypothetical protein ACK2UH_05515, partial [Candidatus Promineifilaceae bacterium]